MMNKLCKMSLGLEKLPVGRNGLLPLCGTANSPSTFWDIGYRAFIFEDKRCDVSLGLEKCLSAGTALSLNGKQSR